MAMINKTEYLTKVKKILEKILFVDELIVPISFETNLVGGVGVESLGLSSIDYVGFLVCIEDEYDIVYEFETQIYTIGDLFEYIVAYKKEKVE